MATESRSSLIADCMRGLVRGQQPSEGGGSSGFNINAGILQQLIEIALESNQNKREIFDKEGLKPITAALDTSYGDEINCLAADLIGLIAEYSEEVARCCAEYRHEGRSVLEILHGRSQSNNMRVRTSAKAALYSLKSTPQLQNQYTITLPPTHELLPNSSYTSLPANLVSRGPTNSVTERKISLPATLVSNSIAERDIFEGEVADDIFRSLAHELGQEWQSLATQLRVPYQSISKLHTDAPHDTSQQCFQMLREHFFNRQCTRLNDAEIKSRLMQALQHRTVGRNDLTEKLEIIIAEASQRKFEQGL